MALIDKTVQVVIEIPEFNYKNIMKVTEGDIDEGIVMDAIRKGQRLPDTHGRLIDAAPLLGEINFACSLNTYNEAKRIVYRAPTVIESHVSEEEADDGRSDERP